MIRARAVVASFLALGVVLCGPALSAAAGSDDVDNPNATWFEIDDGYPTIGDVQSSYPDMLASGVDLPYGWTADAFDGFLSSFSVDGMSISWSLATGGTGWVDHGLSSFLYTGTYGTSPTYEIDAKLEVEGNYARWTFTPVSGPVATFEAGGNLGSDYFQSVTIVSANSAVVSSDDNLADLVIGYWFDGASGTLTVPDAAASSDEVTMTALTSGPITLAVAVQDYAPCAQDVAVDEMIARVASLDSSFGEPIAGALECASAAPPAALEVGTATDQSLAVTIDPAVDPWMASPWGLSSHAAYLSDPSVVGHAFVGAVPGVSFGFDPVTAAVTMTGTPTAAGTFDVTLLLYLTDVDDYWIREAGNGYPLVATLAIEVTEPTLAETGADAGPAGALGFGVIAAGLLTLLLAGLHRRRAARRSGVTSRG